MIRVDKPPPQDDNQAATSREAQAAEDHERQTQLLRGSLDMCLLAVLARRPAYGYELAQRMEAAGFSGVSYGTIYPLLTRMHRLGLVVGEREPSPAGPPRKVYALTATGHARLNAWQRQWRQFTGVVDAILSDSISHPPTSRS